MNNDLISREALKKALENCQYCGFYGELIEIIDNAPPAKPEITEKQAILFLINNGWLVNHDKELRDKWERPQGEWIVTAKDNDGVHRICCPFCSYEKGSNNTDTIIVTFSNFPKFCENCGAKMKGGAE